MPDEIERKFLVRNDTWRKKVRAQKNMQQGYLAVNAECGVRVRIDDDHATLNIKSAGLQIHRKEYEYEIPRAHAQEMLDRLCADRKVVKTRYIVEDAGREWEVDVFGGDNAGLIVAELELDSVDEEFTRPGWLDREVSGDPRYLNSSLATHPYTKWR